MLLTKDELLGDNNPGGDLVFQQFPTTHQVSIVTTGPADTNLMLSIIGPASCHPKWTNPLDPAPTIIASNQISTVTISSVGAATTIAEYTISCDTPGMYNLQIVANVSSPSIPNDPNPTNNQAENIVQVTVVPGDDVGVSVVKEEQITTQEGVTSTHDMTITVTNGNYPADVHLTVLAVSKLGVCEARLIPVGLDHYTEFQTGRRPQRNQRNAFLRVGHRPRWDGGWRDADAPALLLARLQRREPTRESLRDPG